MPSLKGKPVTFGPSAKGKYLAIGECTDCGAQPMSQWKKSRDKATAQVRKEFEEHVCSPELLKKRKEEEEAIARGETVVRWQGPAWEGERR